MLVFILVDYRKLRIERQVVARADDEGISSLEILHKSEKRRRPGSSPIRGR